LRFLPPVPVNPFEDEYLAVDPVPLCAQRDLNRQLAGQEDCLYLDVWTVETDELLPVIVIPKYYFL